MNDSAIAPYGTKLPETDYDLHYLLKKRWSPRSFSAKSIPEEMVLELLSAAQWSASANNEQPWLYSFALRGREQFETLWQHLLPGNQPWARSAAALVVAMARTTFSSTQKPNPWALHDVGMANAQLILQAAHRDIYGHLMAGFDAVKLRNTLALPTGIDPVCMMAIGYLGDPQNLDQPYQSRELAPRARLPLTKIIRPL